MELVKRRTPVVVLNRHVSAVGHEQLNHREVTVEARGVQRSRSGALDLVDVNALDAQELLAEVVKAGARRLVQHGLVEHVCLQVDFLLGAYVHNFFSPGAGRAQHD